MTSLRLVAEQEAMRVSKVAQNYVGRCEHAAALDLRCNVHSARIKDAEAGAALWQQPKRGWHSWR